jgi:phosphoglycolate phosphatase-like HAD superfamily hydrolase
MIVIFDLDGTLALIEKRRALSTKNNQKLDWDVFFDPKNIELDVPNNPVIKALDSFKKNGYLIYIMSGRLDTTKVATIKWLKKHKIVYDRLWMRGNSSEEKYISDVELKQNWLRSVGVENVLCVFDDRAKLVEMWRKNGLTCFQVDVGNF